MPEITHHSHFGVYGLITRRDKILLIKKSRGPYLGLWDLPGGKPEDNETNEAALVREIDEETGLKVQKFAALNSTPIVTKFSYQKDGKPFVLEHSALFYKVEVCDGEYKKAGDGQDSEGADWVSLKSSKQDFTPIVYEAFKLISTPTHSPTAANN